MEDESWVSLAFGWDHCSSRVCKRRRGRSREAFSMDYCLVPNAAGMWRQYVNVIACTFHIGGNCKKVPLVQSKDPVWQSIRSTYWLHITVLSPVIVVWSLPVTPLQKLHSGCDWRELEDAGMSTWKKALQKNWLLQEVGWWFSRWLVVFCFYLFF